MFIFLFRNRVLSSAIKGYSNSIAGICQYKISALFLDRIGYVFHIKPLRIYFIFFFLIGLQSPVFAEGIISADSDLALYQILNLKTNSAQEIIDDSRRNNPDDLYLDYLENWKEVIELIGYEDEKRYEVYVDNFDKRLDRIESLKNIDYPSFNILLGEMYAHAGLANVMYGENLSGFRKILKANNLARKNLEKYPDYWMNLKLNGALNVSFDRIPSILKWLTSLLGLNGDTETGYRQINEYLQIVQDYPGLKSEVLVYKVFINKLSKDEEGAYGMLKKELKDETPPTLLKYLQANIMYRTSRNDEALALLGSFPDGYTEVPFCHLDYLRGKAKMNKLDSDADMYMFRFLEDSKFRNYRREIYTKLAYYYLINGTPEKYTLFINKVADCAKAVSDRDIEATVEAERPYPPHPQLLEVRFLVSGGYMQRGEEILSHISKMSLTIPPYLTEYYLLNAKIEASKNNYVEAIHFFDLAIETGKNQDEHYATEAALLAGDLAYKTGRNDLAMNYWESTFNLYSKKDIYVDNIQKLAKNHIVKSGLEEKKSNSS